MEVYYNFIIIEGSNYITNSSSNSSLFNYSANIISIKDLSTTSNSNSNASSNKKDKKKNDKSKSDNKDK
mgnify:FL=1